jgi:D-glycero-alpha-D-manno-heptose-7-phosphate kinase
MIRFSGREDQRHTAGDPSRRVGNPTARARPRYRAKAPLRISFAGGGTDVPPFCDREGGCVLNATINRYAYGALRPRSDRSVRIESVDFGLSVNYRMGRIPPYDGKLDLVKAAFQKLGGREATGCDLFLHSDAPPGSGLGSSSTLMVTLVGLLREFGNLPLTDYEVANLAYTIERKDLGIKGGLQDQYAATFGGFNLIEIHADQVVVNPLRISQDIVNELEHNLLLCYTGRTRQSDRIIDDQVTRYTRGEHDTVAGLREQKVLAIRMKNSLLQRRLRQFGELLDEAWQAKKKLSPKVTTPEIDDLYAEARRLGALGGKVTGAGGGGYMLLYCQFESKHKVAERLKQMGGQVAEFAFEFHGLQTWGVFDE